MEEYPLFPELSEEAENEAVAFLGGFKRKMLKVVEETLSEVYCNLVPHIETDAWTNFRNELMDGFRNYDNRKVQGEYDFAKIRQKIYEEYRDEIIKDLDQDNLERITKLEAQVEDLNRRLEWSMRR